MPEMQDLYDLLLERGSIVNMHQARMKNVANSRKAFDRLAESRKVPQTIYVIHQGIRESFRRAGMILPGPRENSLQVG
jgi:hypothetical protein